MANIRAELAEFFKQKSLRLWLGYVLPCDKKNAAKVNIYGSTFDRRLNAFFKNTFQVYAYDPEKKSKIGDFVLVKELQENKTTYISHELLKVIYPFGNITDPISGKKVTRLSYLDPVFRDDNEKVIQAFGESPNRFRYEDAPPRGWQEGKRDFTDKEVRVRYHDDGKEDPYKVTLRKNFKVPEQQWPK